MYSPFISGETAAVMSGVASVVLPVAGAAVVYMRLSLSNTIKTFKLDLIRELNGTYTRKERCELLHEQTNKELDRLEDSVVALAPPPQPAHGSPHGRRGGA